LRQFSLLATAVALLLTSSQAIGAETCEGLFIPESWVMSERVQKNKFDTGRDLSDYLQKLHPDFQLKLKSLRSDQHWIDLGAGKALAQIDYIRSFDHPTDAPFATAIAYKLDRWFSAPSLGGKLKVKEGAFETQETSQWQQADLITDHLGVLSYSRDMTTSLQKVFDLLNLNGELYIGVNPQSTTFKIDGASYSLIDFLTRLDGIQVSGRFGSIKIIKVKENIQVPEMELTSYKEAGPPSRTFLIKNAKP
jgi:hypothetical protein